LPHRQVISLLVAGLALCAATASPAPAAGTPAVKRGQALRISVPSHSRTVCTARVVYADGTGQIGTAKKPRGGRVSWSLLVARTTALGAGRWVVSCGRTEIHSGRFTVVATTEGGSSAPADIPRVVVDKQGFSQRNDRFGNGSHVSFGLFLHNTSASQDALDVYVLVNMVAANGELLASMNHNVSLVAAGQTFAYGDSMGLRTQLPVAKLELTVRVGRHDAKQAHPMPEFANVRIIPSDDIGWVSEVDGEVLNTAQGLTLTGTHLSIVLLDAAGNPVGGGNGSTFAELPSGSRMVFTANGGFDSVPIGSAVTPVVSVEPSYAQH